MEFKGCRKCKKGWIINEKTEEVEKCSCLIKYQNSIESQSALERSNIPMTVKDYSIDQYIGEDENKNIQKLNKYVEEFEDKFNKISLFCRGANSTQKTTVLSYVGLKIALKGFSVIYITMQDLLKHLINEQFKEESQEKIRELEKVSLLIIDESFDLRKITLYKSNFQIPFLNEFLKKRIEQYRLATIFISNAESLDYIGEKFDLSLKILIERSCIELVFKDNINIKNNFNIKDLWG